MAADLPPQEYNEDASCRAQKLSQMIPSFDITTLYSLYSCILENSSTSIPKEHIQNVHKVCLNLSFKSEHLEKVTAALLVGDFSKGTVLQLAAHLETIRLSEMRTIMLPQ